MLLPLLALCAPPLENPALARMIATERAFAAECGRVGLRDSFIHYFAPDGLMFPHGPVNARKHLSALPRRRDEYVLNWKPTRAEISRAGDIGFSTGPVYVTDSKAKTTSRTGTFFSIWKRQPDGQYRVLLDVGTPVKPGPVRPSPFYRNSVPPSHPDTNPAFNGLELERAFAKASDREGFSTALRKVLAPDAWLYRRGFTPLPGAQASPQMANRWVADAAVLAKSRDFLVTRGRYEVAADGPERVEYGNFIRVWRHQTDGWKVVIDHQHPLPRRR